MALTKERASAVVRYENGRLFWNRRPLNEFKSEQGCNAFNAAFSGKEAGCESAIKKGHRYMVRIDRTLYPRARIVFLIHYGYMPKIVDHINRDTLDDRIENLRAATRTQNQANAKRRKHCQSGYKGVARSRNGSRWHARIRKDGKCIHIGTYDSPAEAHAAYVAKAKELFGEFACAG